MVIKGSLNSPHFSCNINVGYKVVFVVVVVVARPVLVYWAVCGHENEISKQLKYEIEKSRKNRPADIES